MIEVGEINDIFVGQQRVEVKTIPIFIVILCAILEESVQTLKKVSQNSQTNLQILSLAFLAILFLQSGLDKVFNYKGNLEWLTGHFAKSPLKNTVGLLMPVITILEVAAGVFSAIGLVQILLQAFNKGNPKEIFGTNLPSMTSKCNQSA